MPVYRNLSGDSGVVSYELGEGQIIVTFKGGHTYLYTDRSTTSVNIEQMKSLAVAGKGLGSFIKKVVKKGYASKS